MKKYFILFYFIALIFSGDFFAMNQEEKITEVLKEEVSQEEQEKKFRDIANQEFDRRRQEDKEEFEKIAEEMSGKEWNRRQPKWYLPSIRTGVWVSVATTTIIGIIWYFKNKWFTGEDAKKAIELSKQNIQCKTQKGGELVNKELNQVEKKIGVTQGNFGIYRQNVKNVVDAIPKALNNANEKSEENAKKIIQDIQNNKKKHTKKHNNIMSGYDEKRKVMSENQKKDLQNLKNINDEVEHIEQNQNQQNKNLNIIIQSIKSSNNNVRNVSSSIASLNKENNQTIESLKNSQNESKNLSLNQKSLHDNMCQFLENDNQHGENLKNITIGLQTAMNALMPNAVGSEKNKKRAFNSCSLLMKEFNNPYNRKDDEDDSDHGFNIAENK